MANNQFKVGQKLKVVMLATSMERAGIKKHEIVTVTGLRDNDYADWIGPRVYVNGLTNDDFGYDEDRFVAVEEAAIDFTKPVQTRGGRPVTIITTEARGKYPVMGYIGDNHHVDHFTLDGRFYIGMSGDVDLMNVPEKKAEKEVYFNVYKDVTDASLFASTGHASRAQADSKATSERVGVVKAMLVEGQFDE